MMMMVMVMVMWGCHLLMLMVKLTVLMSKWLRTLHSAVGTGLHLFKAIGRRRKMSANNVDLRSMRQPYKDDKEILVEDSLPSKDPLKLFTNWFQLAKNCENILEANAVCVATADKNGIPSARMVLLKSYGEDGFKFFTNYCSQKGHDLLENPNAALLFYWDPLNRQIRINGKVEQLPEHEAIDYFTFRPKKSQIAAAISNQSHPVESRDNLVEKYKQLEEEYAEATHLPKPSTWGGFRVVPYSFEFWQGQSSRLHDRIRFRKLVGNEVIDNKLLKAAEDGWFMERLQP